MSHARWEITDADRSREGYQEARRATCSGRPSGTAVRHWG